LGDGVLIVSEPEQHLSGNSRHREQELRRASDFHAVLLTMAGHDLRQPLQVIMSVYEGLMRRLKAGSEREYLRRGERAIAALTEQLDHLVDAVRPHERAECIEPMRVELGTLLAGLCRYHSDAARQKGLSLRFCSTRAAVMSDPLFLHSIMHNLVRNAVKYTPPGGRVLVGCRHRGFDVRIDVHDTGIGIPPDHLSKVFDAFRRLDSTRSDGLGLGLFVVRRAVEILGHRIEVRSQLDRGSCFSILAKAWPFASTTSPLSLRSANFCHPARTSKYLLLPHA
jgi:two-component system phosphate regulon sensor histidine kinase PhoR